MKIYFRISICPSNQQSKIKIEKLEIQMIANFKNIIVYEYIVLIINYF